MTDLEYDIFDELYFVTSFEQIQKELSIKEQDLKDILLILIKKAWVRCFFSATMDVVVEDEIDFEKNYQNYHYLATKEGLLMHNSR